MRPASLIRALFLLGLLFGLQRASGAQVNWGTTRLATNLTSDGEVMGQNGEFHFEVGSFAQGFTPTAQNVEQWAENWRVADCADYSVSFAFAAGSVAGSAIVPVGGRGYIWGFNSRGPGDVEWILVTDPSWIWTAPDAQMQPVDWTVGTASEVIVGQVDVSGVHMQTVAFFLQGGRAADLWRTQHFAGAVDSPQAAWSADPDGDGVPNALEFAFDTSPLAISEAVRPVAQPVRVAGGEVMRVVFTGEPHPEAVLRIEVSTDLRTWSPIDNSVQVITENGQMIIEDSVPLDVEQRYFRVTVVL